MNRPAFPLSRTICLGIGAALLLAAAGSGTVGGSVVDDVSPFVRPLPGVADSGSLDEQVAYRRQLGFRATPAYVSDVIADSRSLSDLGLSLTPDEHTALTTRLAFQARVLNDVLPRLEAEPGFSGAYFDSQSDGRLIVHVARPVTTTMEALRNTVPNLSLPIEFVEVDVTFADLHAGVDRLSKGWSAIFGDDLRFLSIASDKRTLSLEVRVDQQSLKRVEGSRAQLAALADPLSVAIAVGVPYRDSACTDREHCTSPQKGGNVIRKGSTSGGQCTMGWHVQVGSDEQYLTAGHCGYTGSNNWYHQGWGLVGAETATLYPTWEVDAMRLQITDTQDSSQVWGISGNITSSGWPVVGTNVWASRGVSNVVASGTVIQDYLSWTSTTCNCTMYGAQGSWSTNNIGGDSGAPVLSVNGQAWGLLVTSGGHFPRLQEVLDAWGITLRV